jgi:hypothetical protein
MPFSKIDSDVNVLSKRLQNTFKSKSALTNAVSGNRLIGRVMRPYYLHKRFKYDHKIRPKGPILDAGDIKLYPFQNFTIGASLSPVTPHLGDAGYPWVNESPHSVG